MPDLPVPVDRGRSVEGSPLEEVECIVEPEPQRAPCSYVGTSSASPSMEVAALYIYPIKSCAAVPVDSVQCTEFGFAHDREYAIVDLDTNEVMTQRKLPKMATLQSRLQGAHSQLVLSTARLDWVRLVLQQEKVVTCGYVWLRVVTHKTLRIMYM